MFLLLALGWVLVAGVMNSVRFVDAFRAEMAMASRRQQLVTTVFGGIGANGQVTIRMLPTPAAPTAGSIWDVSATTWARMVWGATLVVGGAAGLLWLARAQRVAARRVPAGAGAVCREPGRHLVPYAWGLFAIYAGWHVFFFLRELTGL